MVIGFVFWLLTDLTEFFFKKKNHFNKKLFYECGFRSISDIKLNININFQMPAIFLILYDIEFIFFICIALNIAHISAIVFCMFINFYALVIFSLYYDILFNAMN